MRIGDELDPLGIDALGLECIVQTAACIDQRQNRALLETDATGLGFVCTGFRGRSRRDGGYGQQHEKRQRGHEPIDRERLNTALRADTWKRSYPKPFEDR